MTAAALLQAAASKLRAAGVEAAEWDAESLLRHVLGWDRATLLTRGTTPLAGADEQRFLELVEQRARRVPLQHLVGTQAFWRHEFAVSRDVLVPRPETELLVETALAVLRGASQPVLVDVGTGSGCIALSVAAERPDARVHATDVSPAALAVARLNARRLDLEGRVSWHEGDLLDPVASLAGTIALVVSNPPYVDEKDGPSLAPEVREHEPALALFAGEGGLAVYRRLVPAAASVLRHDGTLLLELGAGQQLAVERLCSSAGLEIHGVHRDLQSIPRVLEARKNSLTPRRFASEP